MLHFKVEPGPWPISVMRQFARVRNLGAGDRPDLLGRYSDDRSRPAGQGDELDLVSLLARINVNDCSNVARLQTLVGKRCGQNDSIVFVNHVGNLLEGWAVTSLGSSAPLSMIQTVRIDGVRPSGHTTGPSIRYLVPYRVSDIEATG